MDALREKYPVEDWQYEVANGDTVLGYEEWLLHCKERDEHDQHSERGYECTVSCAGSAKSPCAAARDFLADLGKPNAPWCISVRNLDNDQHYTVSLPSGNVEESDEADEAWDKRKGISARIGDNYTLNKHKEIVSVTAELLDKGMIPDYIRAQLYGGYNFPSREIVQALLEWLYELNNQEKDEMTTKKRQTLPTVDLVAYLEMARIALDRDDVRDQIAEGTDLSDEEIQRLTVQLNKHLDEGKPKMNRKETHSQCP